MKNKVRSFLFIKKLIRLRKEMPLIAQGSYQAALTDSDKIYAFEREYEGQRLLVLNNFFAETVELDLPSLYQAGTILIGNYEKVVLTDKILLKPYQTVAILAEV